MAAYEICPWCNQKITSGVIPWNIHRKICPKRPK